jgi:DNA-binding MarR family transcriptional regulator
MAQILETIESASRQLERLLKARAHQKTMSGASRSGVPQADAVLELDGFIFALEVKRSGDAALIRGAIEQARMTAAASKAIPLIVVPFMGETGRRMCENAGVSWLDQSGNAHIEARGLHIHIEGKPNAFKHRGRPSSIFAPKSSRITRHLLMHPGQFFTQRELASSTGLGEGFTSRIIGRLEETGLVKRDASHRVAVSDRELLLDAWAEAYDFSRHQILKGHVPARSSTALAEMLGSTFTARGQEYAFTGLAAAWLIARFAGHRLVTVYVAQPPSEADLRHLSFREDARGANVWLVVPNDASVFVGAQEREGLRCVHPIQAWLDLNEQPERASEASAVLRARLWDANDR